MGVTLGDYKEFPTTDKYNIAVNVNLGDKTVSDVFQKAAKGAFEQESYVAMIRALAGRDTINIQFNDADGTSYNMINDDGVLIDEISVSSKFIDNIFLGADDPKAPPNIPESFTPEMLVHLITLHEVEHTTQYKFDVDSENRPISSTATSNVINGDFPRDDDLAFKIITEADGDNTIIQYLENTENEDIAQYWLDMRMNRSFMAQFNPYGSESFEYDTASIVSHFRETGEVLDVDHFLDQKGELMELVREQMGMGGNRRFEINMEYPEANQAIRYNKELDLTKYARDMVVSPNAMMHAVKTLLEDDRLEGMQKWEAENYMASMERLGYEPDPDPDYSYEEVLRAGLEQITKDDAAMKAAHPDEPTSDQNNDPAVTR